MEPKISFITLGVSDLVASTRFYSEVLRLPQLPTPDGVTFFEMGTLWLALYPAVDLAADAGVPSEGSGFPRFTLAHNVRTREAVDVLLAEVAGAGGRVVRAPDVPEWGGYRGYFADPDGFLWEIAWNPHFPHV